MRCRLMLLDEFPGTLLIIVSLLDVAGEAYLIAGGLDVNAFLSCVSNLDIVEGRGDVWIFAAARLAVSLMIPPLCLRLALMKPRQDANMEVKRRRRGPPKEEKDDQGNTGGWIELLCMALAGLAGTALLTKTAFVLVFDTDAATAGRWSAIVVSTVATLIQYLLQRAVTRSARNETKVDSGGLQELLLDGGAETGAAVEGSCRGAGKEAGGAANKADNGEWSKLGSKRQVLSRLIGMARPDWPWMAGGLVFLGVAAVSQAIVPKLTGDVINDIVLEGSSAAFGSALMNLSIASLVTAAASGFRGSCFLVAMAKMNIRIRTATYAAILRQDISFFDQSPTGDLTSRLSSDTTKMSESISLNLNVFFRSLVQAVGVLALMCTLQWRLTVVTFMAVPLIIAASQVYGDYYKTLTTLVQDCQASSNACAEEAIGSMRTVRSFANEDEELSDYCVELSGMLKINFKQAWAYLGYGSFVTLAPLITTVTVLYFGGHLVLQGTLKPGDLVSFVFYQQSLSQAINSMGDVFTGLMQAAGAADKVFLIIDREPNISLVHDDSPVVQRMQGSASTRDSDTADDAHRVMRGHVRFDAVSFNYGSREDAAFVLNGVSFEALPGEVVALVGKSGSGKSSCMSLLQHFYEPTSGQITIDGRPLTSFSHKFLHRQVSLVGQEPVLYSRSVRDNITYGLPDGSLSDEEVHRAAQLACAHDFVCEMKEGYDTQVGERGSHLSGGQKQRIAIARALSRDPAVLLLDEATSALDSESEGLVQAAIDRSTKGRTVIVIAHRLSTIRSADKIVVMNAGKVVEVGPHAELVRRGGAYASLVSKQLGREEREVTGDVVGTPGGGGGGSMGLAGWFGLGASGGGSGRRPLSPVTPRRETRRFAGGHGTL